MAAQPIPLRLRLPYATEDEFLSKVGTSLAAGELFVGTRSPKPVGTLLAFEFVLAEGQRVLVGRGRVLSLSGDAQRPGMTLSLEALDAPSRAIVARAIVNKDEAFTDPAEIEKRRRQALLDAPAPQGFRAGENPVLGIDLGMTVCRAAVCVDGVPKLLPLEGRNTSLPSIVAFDDKGRLLVGTRAKAHVLVDPKSSIFGGKRLIGRRGRSRKVKEMAARFPYEVCPDEHGDAAVRVQGKIIPVPQLASYLLAEIRNRASDALGTPVTRVVIGVPAYFNDHQRGAVRYAGQLAGLEVQRVLNEPTAVAIAVGQSFAGKRLLVYDLGGGVFDASVLESTGEDFEVAAAGGDNFLGGLDFDARLAGWLEDQFNRIQQFALPADPLTRQRVRDAAEMAKISLSEKPETRVHLPFVATRHNNPVDLDVLLPRGHFETLTRDLVERSLAVVSAVFEAAQLAPTSADEVLLVGGQSQSPFVRTAVEKLTGRRAHRNVDPYASVAFGTALVGAAMRDSDSENFAL